MPVRKIEANPQVPAAQGMLAIQRGPIIYCLEGVDQPVPLNALALPMDSELKPVKRPDLLGGIVTITGVGKAIDITDWSGKLYRDAVGAAPVKITAIPYYAWDNREACPMEVWIPAQSEAGQRPGVVRSGVGFIHAVGAGFGDKRWQGAGARQFQHRRIRRLWGFLFGRVRLVASRGDIRMGVLQVEQADIRSAASKSTGMPITPIQAPALGRDLAASADLGLARRPAAPTPAAPTATTPPAAPAAGAPTTVVTLSPETSAPGAAATPAAGSTTDHGYQHHPEAAWRQEKRHDGDRPA